MFVHSVHIILHILVNMLIFLISVNCLCFILSRRELVVIYLFSGATSGMIHDILNIFLLYHRTGEFELYKVSHEYYNQNYYLQYAMFTPLIGSSGAIASIVLLTCIKLRDHQKRRRQFLLFWYINWLFYNLIYLFPFLTITSHCSHISGAFSGYYTYKTLKTFKGKHRGIVELARFEPASIQATNKLSTYLSPLMIIKLLISVENTINSLVSSVIELIKETLINSVLSFSGSPNIKR